MTYNAFFSFKYIIYYFNIKNEIKGKIMQNKNIRKRLVK